MNLSRLSSLYRLFCVYMEYFRYNSYNFSSTVYHNLKSHYIFDSFRCSVYSWNFRTPGTRVTRDDFIDVEVGVVGRVPSIQRHFRATWAPFRPHLWIWPLCSSMFKITLHLGWTSLSLDDEEKKREPRGRINYKDFPFSIVIITFDRSLCETIAIFFS